ncbi:MAG: phage portal protein [Akkermansiaceae bacterium]
MSKRGSRGGRRRGKSANNQNPSPNDVTRSAKSEGNQGSLMMAENDSVADLRKRLINYLDGGGYDAARRSERRGFIHFPTLDTRKELRAPVRKEIIKKARWADNNVGLIIRALDAPTNLIGVLSPQSECGDAEWGKEAEAAFNNRVSSPELFDRAGKMDFEGWQDSVVRCSLRDGDTLTALLEDEATAGGQVLMYEAHQVDDGKFRDSQQSISDGVFMDKMGRNLGYSVIDMNDAEAGAVVPASAGVYVRFSTKPGAPRGVSAVAHALSNIVDIVEILADTKHGVKIAAQWGVVMETAAGQKSGGNIGSELAAFLGAGAETADASDDDALNLDEILRGGRMQETPAGSTIKTLQDARPHPNQLDLLRWLVRDISWGLGLAPEVLWEMSGLSGTATRYMMADTRKWVKKKQKILKRACHKVWVYVLSREIEAGRLRRPPKNLKRPFKCKWIPEADPTIDEGRVGALELKQLAAGAISYSDVFAKRGQDWEAEFDQMAKEKKARVELGLEKEDVAPAVA